MKLSTRSRYGTRILLELARSGEKAPVQVSEISRRQEIPAKYLEQLIRTLKQAELVTSVRGPKGGHLLAKSPENITLGQIVVMFRIDELSLTVCRIRIRQLLVDLDSPFQITFSLIGLCQQGLGFIHIERNEHLSGPECGHR